MEMLQSLSFWMKRGHLDSHYGWPCLGTGSWPLVSVVCKVMLFIFLFGSCELWKHLKIISVVYLRCVEKENSQGYLGHAGEARTWGANSKWAKETWNVLCLRQVAYNWHSIMKWSKYGNNVKCVPKCAVCCLPKITMRSLGVCME
jgi:hypothetical protein